MIKSRSVTILVPGLLAVALGPLHAGDVVGRIKYAGTPPAPAKIAITKDQAVCDKVPHVDETLVVGADKGVKNAVVSLTDVNDGRKMTAPPKNVSIDQNGCKFNPRVQIVAAGASLDIINSDGILHNIHTTSKANTPFNKAQPKFRKVMTEKFEKPELIRVACDVHTWMAGWLVVAGHPYYALTDGGGAFTIAGVPAGTYTLESWHEKLGKQTGKVTVSASGPVSVDLEYAAK